MTTADQPVGPTVYRPKMLRAVNVIGALSAPLTPAMIYAMVVRNERIIAAGGVVAVFIVVVGGWCYDKAFTKPAEVIDNFPIGITREDANRRSRICARIAIPAMLTAFLWLVPGWWPATLAQLVVGGVVFAYSALYAGWASGLVDAAAMAAGSADAGGGVDELRMADPDVWDLPGVRDGSGYLYVIRFSGGTVKVGKTRDPRRRMAEHQRESMRYAVMTDVWVSAPHRGYHEGEQALIAEAIRRYPDRVRQEYFYGADFDALVAFAETLVASRVAPSAG